MRRGVTEWFKVEGRQDTTRQDRVNAVGSNPTVAFHTRPFIWAGFFIFLLTGV
jgi:hypothetical protein